MKKKLVCLLLAATLALSGCAIEPDENSEQENSSTITTVEQSFNYRIIVDTETGVMYVKWTDAGIIPMFNADGTLKIWEGDE